MFIPNTLEPSLFVFYITSHFAAMHLLDIGALGGSNGVKGSSKMAMIGKCVRCFVHRVCQDYAFVYFFYCVWREQFWDDNNEMKLKICGMKWSRNEDNRSKENNEKQKRIKQTDWQTRKEGRQWTKTEQTIEKKLGGINKQGCYSTEPKILTTRPCSALIVRGGEN